MLLLHEGSSPAAHECEPRHRFGLVADEYDQARPGYPPQLIDAVVAYAGVLPGDRALDIGTGTGQAALALAQRGLSVLGVDASATMAAIANRKFAAAGLDARAIVSDFEAAPLGEGAFSLICAATSWHWLDPDTRFPLAARAVADGGTLAVLWTWPHWRRTALRPALDEVYKRSGAPLVEMAPMYTVEPDATALAQEWVHDTAASGSFGDPRAAMAGWSVTYTAPGYAALLGTYGDHIGLDPAVRATLLDGIERVIDEAGGTIEVLYSTLLLLARAR